MSEMTTRDFRTAHSGGNMEWPTADLLKLMERERVGHWNIIDECGNEGYYCSECNKKVVKIGWSDTVKKIKYCPNCGAKMEGTE